MTPITIDHSEKPQMMGLDSSTRAKIVIRTKPPTSKRYIGPTVSIFSPKNRYFSLDLSAPPLETPVQEGLGKPPLPQPTNNPSPQPSPLTPKMIPKSKTIEDSKVKKQRHLSSTPAAFPERKTIPPSKLRISSTPSSATPTPEPDSVKPTPISSTSQYAEEYDKCPCAKGRAMGRPPCDRCKLMLLADRFCKLIDVQCHKWGIPPKH